VADWAGGHRSALPVACMHIQDLKSAAFRDQGSCYKAASANLSVALQAMSVSCKVWSKIQALAREQVPGPAQQWAEPLLLLMMQIA